jgi:hypothetical protein
MKNAEVRMPRGINEKPIQPENFFLDSPRAATRPAAFS